MELHITEPISGAKDYMADLKSDAIGLVVCQHDNTSLHRHNFLELVYINKGTSLHTLNHTRARIKPGDYFIVDYGDYHKFDNLDGSDLEVINCLFTPAFIDRSLAGKHSFGELLNNYLIKFSYRSFQSPPTHSLYHDDSNRTVYHLMQKLLRENEEKAPGYLELMRSCLIEIIILTLRTITKQDQSPSDENSSKAILDYIDAHYMEPITLHQFCGQLNYSLPYLSKKFKEDTGIGFRDYLQKKRVEQSCRLLANTDKKIMEIAELVGYDDLKFFNRVFKKSVGVTPREFKKMHV